MRKSLTRNSRILAIICPRSRIRRCQELDRHSRSGQTSQSKTLTRSHPADVVVRVVQDDFDRSVALIDCVCGIGSGLIIHGSNVVGTSQGHGRKVGRNRGRPYSNVPTSSTDNCQ